ncbi:MAG: DUF3592 domain-containing protein [Candidatus Hydrogenedentes bacterium]|nr:DUF3592 domain-containing protein [Candidatus Hydrogenedentota bacterium]
MASSPGSKSGVKQFLVFALVLIFGASLFYLLTVTNYQKTSAVKTWKETPCKISRSEVTSRSEIRDGRHRTYYNAELAYAYTFDGKEYRGSGYGFGQGSSTSRAKADDIVAANPVGAERVCYVNPNDPSEAVLNRDLPTVALIGVLGIFMVLIGLGGMVRAFLPKRAVAPRADGSVVLRPQSSPLMRFGVTTCTAIGIGVATVFLFSENVAFLGLIFGAFAVLLGIGAVYFLLAFFNPRVTVTVTTLEAAPGDMLGISWEFSGSTVKLQTLKVLLKGMEETRVRRGNKSSKKTETFEETVLYETTDPAEMKSSEVGCLIPETARPTGTEGDSRVYWQLCIHGTIPMWPDVREEYEITVTPAVAAVAPAPAT